MSAAIAVILLGHIAVRAAQAAPKSRRRSAVGLVVVRCTRGLAEAAQVGVVRVDRHFPRPATPSAS